MDGFIKRRFLATAREKSLLHRRFCVIKIHLNRLRVEPDFYAEYMKIRESTGMRDEILGRHKLTEFLVVYCEMLPESIF